MWVYGTLLLDAWRDDGGGLTAAPLAVPPALLFSLPRSLSLGRLHGGGAAASSGTKTTRKTTDGGKTHRFGRLRASNARFWTARGETELAKYMRRVKRT
jgi:hypothetical protein